MCVHVGVRVQGGLGGGWSSNLITYELKDYKTIEMRSC